MKRIIYAVMLLAGTSTFAQTPIDDGLITSHLTVNKTDVIVSDFVSQFYKGIANFKAAVYPTINDLLEKEGYDLVNQPKLEDWLASDQSPVSIAFLKKLIKVKNDIGDQYQSVEQVRQALTAIAVGETLPYYEAVCLASLDIAMQAIQANFEMQSGTDGQFAAVMSQEKLPRWLRCVFGVVSGAVTGAVHGALIGTGFLGIGVAAGAGTGLIAGGVAGGSNAC